METSQKENIVPGTQVIDNELTIQKIIAVAFGSSIPAIIRLPDKPAVSVRARTQGHKLNVNPGSISLTKISPQGMQHLVLASVVSVEITTAAAHLQFLCNVLKLTPNGAILGIPKQVISLNRRANQRVQTTQKKTAFIKFSLWKPKDRDFGTHPRIPLFSDVSDLIAVQDVSEGGLALCTRFPTILDAIVKDLIDPEATLHLPLRNPIKVQVSVRWIRRIKETVSTDEPNIQQRYYKLGLQFENPSSELSLILRAFIADLSLAEAI